MATPTQRRLLYIEDNAINTLVVEELLSRRPALSLSCEEDGARGLQSAQTQPPELILLDMHLPDCDGYEVLKQLRADPRTAHIPCIALSATAKEEDHRRALAAGFLAYWTKPIDFKAFLDGLDAFFAPSLQASAQSLSEPR
ncbi:response regulator [Paucibacter sp. Y2R2-4]|uniref:response regulator n=1 Tax=Paucibacter sp. Y2R2-4 TaxID=2893553 RepID=UPI0021E38540|nr:response regulator [Paucibacter sp. Y2R2-4]MCV2348815.1 response regulator [Paucibacter sp. Y2R2-4]